MSKVEVDQITQQSGTTLTVGGGACKTAVVDATTVTLGRCGGTVSLASGATQSGFGRSGSVNWQTTPKTTTFTPVNGEGYFINSGSALTANLPAGSPGAIVAFADYARNFATYNFSVSPNGSEKMGGVADDAKLTINGQAATFVYVDSTKGWVNVQNAEDTETGATFMSATVSGACNTLVTAPDCANVKIATFLNPGTFCVSSISGCATNNTVSYMVVGGGGGGGAGGSPGYGRGAGGAGGFREYKSPATPYTSSPLDGNPGGTSVVVTATAFPICIGGGGAGGDPGGPSMVTGTNGTNTTFATIISAGGGGGAGNNPPGAQNGGSGGGASDAPYPAVPFAGGTGNTPATVPSQGNDGGPTGPTVTPAGGGGGGATAAGQAGGTSSPHFGGTGGAGATTSISATPTAYAGGGGGGGCSSGDPSGAPGGAGGGGSGGGAPSYPATAGTDNTGGGGGGATWSAGAPGGGKQGGSGIVIIRYRFQ